MAGRSGLAGLARPFAGPRAGRSRLLPAGVVLAGLLGAALLVAGASLPVVLRVVLGLLLGAAAFVAGWALGRTVPASAPAIVPGLPGLPGLPGGLPPQDLAAAEHPSSTSAVATAGAGEDPAAAADHRLDGVSDPRALQLLVRAMETTLEEQNAALAEMQRRVREAEQAERQREAHADAQAELGRHRTQVVMAALQHLHGPSASARIDAAVGRIGVPTVFARPPIAAFLPTEEPPAADAGEALPSSEEAEGGESAAPADEPGAAPEEPEVVLPVPPPPPEPEQPRRRRRFRGAA